MYPMRRIVIMIISVQHFHLRSFSSYFMSISQIRWPVHPNHIHDNVIATATCKSHGHRVLVKIHATIVLQNYAEGLVTMNMITAFAFVFSALIVKWP
jgi:hypothetical protein